MMESQIRSNFKFSILSVNLGKGTKTKSASNLLNNYSPKKKLCVTKSLAADTVKCGWIFYLDFNEFCERYFHFINKFEQAKMIICLIFHIVYIAPESRISFSEKSLSQAMSINKVQNKPSIYDQSLQNDYFIRRQLDQFASISDCKSLKSSKNSTKGIFYIVSIPIIFI